MTPRIVASGYAAVLGFGFLGFGLMLAPVEAQARGGGLAAPRGPSAAAGIGPMVAKPAMSGGAAVGIHPWHAKPDHHRRPFRHGAQPVVWGAPYWYGADQSPLYVMPYDPPADDLSAYPTAGTGPTPRHISVVARPPTCSSQTMKVPSESGGERAITVTRC
jgi:hypothetical protein